MKKVYAFIITIVLFLLLASCSNGKKEGIKIIYTNDIHSYIGNTKKDNDGNQIAALRLNNISGYVNKLRSEKKDVLFVDAGDEIQGAIYGAMSNGNDMIPLLNAVGYDLATPGNHDFDYGMDAFNSFVNNVNYPFISCNFKSKETNENVFDSYKIFDFDDVKVAFVGISTPETITSSTPKFFQNSNGEYIYSFDGEDNKEDLYSSVQKTINNIRDEAQYVIGLGHLGVGADAISKGFSSYDVIKNTTGLDAFIDAHSHTTIEGELVKSKDGKDVLLTQTGSYLKAFGEMDLVDGEIKTKLITDVSESDSSVKALEDALILKVDSKLGEKIGILDNDLTINYPDINGYRIIRSRETNLANLVSDSFYWYLNEEKELDCDITIQNGGGIRDNIEKGDITYKSCKGVMPFGNQVCLIKTKGKNIKDAIEMGLNVVEKEMVDKDTGITRPAEYGGFIHAAGLKYDVDCSIPSSVELESNGMFKCVSGDYRVKNIMIYNKTTKEYEEFDEEKEYTVGGINYTLRNSGDGMSMFNDSELILDYIEEDYTAFAKFLMSFKNGDNVIVNNNNSPLKEYTNYLYDYENPSGSGRINLLNL